MYELSIYKNGIWKCNMEFYGTYEEFLDYMEELNNRPDIIAYEINSLLQRFGCVPEKVF